MKKNSIISLINMYRDLKDYNNKYKELTGNEIDNDLFLSFLEIPQIIIADLYPNISDDTSDMLYNTYMHLLDNTKLSPETIYDVMISFI